MRRALAFFAGAVTGALAWEFGRRAIKAHWWALLMLLTVTSCAAAHPKPKTVRLRAQLSATPRVALAPVRVTCMLRVWDPQRLVRCPSIVEWVVGRDGERIGSSGMVTPMAPCEPFGLIENVPTHLSETKSFRWARRGLYEIAAGLGSVHAVGCDRTTVEVR